MKGNTFPTTDNSYPYEDNAYPMAEPVVQKKKKGVEKFADQVGNGAMKGVKAVGGVVDNFKEFLNRGNVVDLAVGIVMGAAFTAIVTSLVQDIVTPFISLGTAVNLQNNFLVLRCPRNNATNSYPPRSSCVDFWKTTADAQKAGAVTWNWGMFVQTIINFFIISVMVFFIVKVYAAAFRRKKADPKTKPCIFCCKDIPIKATRCPECTSTVEEPSDLKEPIPAVVVDRWGGEKKTW
ncbi:large conductance mechanosensitive channel protein [Spizellomyces punctatus DAOM BR117]|uniref:Large conductance mechanosensitive channel protein n=1 Tax=Spizellomyces punctatus (strain DAOM BR117) TaxID=645134 RepID=A0A0L0H4R7_SPIPD|nr:large conductance mechanosensitive channel protein [Spizellomyces punctatus DAOM BR117]KNC95964.1 large conductance mechanosensitive channel protein [Spizellomyces punctatus DAOM BR117]|eukprot:XP_016604004.1 large conductance mechanosensitive channel protein [Spizellomyces punctatus DAOM BR117]